MEVQGSLKLFGGLEAIKKTLRAELERRQITASLCAAPTALAALWLVRHRSGDVRLQEKLVGSLSVLPLKVTGWPENIQSSLQSMGLQTIGDCLRLPRDGFSRRIGRQYLLQLDRALGGYESRPEFRPPQRLSSTLELTDEVSDPAVLSHAGENLIENLAEILRQRQIGVTSFEIVFKHLHRPATIERINLVGPTQDQERFSRLFLDRLEQVVLPAPVVALALKTGRVEAVVARNATLFRDSIRPQAIDAIDRLIERLRGRFGTARIFGINLVEEHRPEAAWAKALDLLTQKHRGAVLNSPWVHHRPLWLLPKPLSLPSTTSGFPCCHGREALQPKSGPERIETGWWNGNKISRDYYTALNSKGEKLWIYQDRYAVRNWYLHGIFG
jgi:protein ImuB